MVDSTGKLFLTSIEQCISSSNSRVIVIGATNNPHMLDAALIRPGRLNPVIRIPRPDATALAGIFRSHLKEDLAGEDLSGIAHLASGASGADVVGYVKQARASARAEARRMVFPDLVQAIAPKDDRSEEERLVVARHEAAHAAAALFYDLGTLRSISIIADGSTAGSTRATLHPRGIMTREQTEALAIVALAGRAMDALGGAVNSGSGGGPDSDLAQATALVTRMHGSFGLGETLLFRGGPKELAAALSTDIGLRQTCERHIQRLYAQACSFVREHRPSIEAVAERLVVERVLSGEEVTRILRAHRRPTINSNQGGRDVR